MAQCGGDFALPGACGEVEIDEAWAGDLDARHVVAGRQCGDQRLRQRARIGARGFRQQHRRVGGEIAMLAGLGSLDHEVRDGRVGRQGAAGTQRFDALDDQGVEEGLHGERRFMRFGRAFYPVCPRASGLPPSAAGAGLATTALTEMSA